MMRHMNYDPITASHWAYLDKLELWERIEEDYTQSDYYQDGLEDFGGTEQEYRSSVSFSNAVEAFYEEMSEPDHDY